MKKIFVVVMLLLCSFSLFAQLPTVAISRFDGTGVTSEEAQVVTELFIAELVSTGAVNVVDRNSFDRIMNEMRFQDTDWASSNRTIELGRALNAEYIIRGQFMQMGSRLFLTATMINANTAQIVSSAREQFENLDNIFRRLPAFCQQIIERLPSPNLFIGKWQSTIAGFGYICILEFKQDMSIVVDRFDWQSDCSTNGYTRTVHRGRGTGTYTYNSNEITISLNITFPEGRRLFSDNYNRTIILPYSFSDNNNRFNFSQNRGFLLNGYEGSPSNAPYHYYSSFTRIR